MSTRIKDFFTDKESFEEILEAAEEQDLSFNAASFVDELSIKYADYGMEAFITQGQVNWLKDLAKI